ncbi:MAG TPA: DoxX family protein [Chitinophagaceae bacterium]
MKKTKILYWVFTGLFAIMMVGSAIPDIFSVQIAREGFTKIGMPVYLLPFLGWAKFAGVVAILLPGFSRLKEWAYAGLFFDLIGATYAIIASGQAVGQWAPMVLPVALAVLSYVYYQKKVHIKNVHNTTVSGEKLQKAVAA